MEATDECSHSETAWTFATWRDEWADEERGEWQSEEVSYIVDIDLHRYQCTRCKRIGYYSSAAKAFHEDGRRAIGVLGLE